MNSVNWRGGRGQSAEGRTGTPDHADPHQRLPRKPGHGILHDLRERIDLELVMIDFRPMMNSMIGELSAKFDVVIGQTPADWDHDG
jgi:hypothetical protein